MKFRVTKIAAAVAAGLGVSVAGMNVAQADELFFPYIFNGSTVSTILSVINNDDVAGAVKNLHYRYFYKTTDSNSAACVPSDYLNSSSPNDVVTFDTGGVYGDDKGVLFEPVASQINAKYRNTFALFKAIKPVVAFGLVDNNTSQEPRTAHVNGEAINLEFGTGSAWGYKGYNHAKIWSLVPPVAPATVGTLVLQNAFDFSDRAETTGDVMVPRPADGDPASYWVPVNIMPFDQVTTRFFVTPVSTNQINTSLAASIGLRARAQSGATDSDVMYDRDENPFSGNIDQAVVCVGRVNATSLISSATLQFLASGGWSNVAVLSGQATVIKLEFNPNNPSSLDGKTIPGSFNNAVWLRKGIREGTARTAGLAVNTDIPALATFRIASGNDTLENNSPFPVLNTTAVTAAAGLARSTKATTSLPSQLGLSSTGAGVAPTTLSVIAGQVAALYTTPSAFATQAQVSAAIDEGKFSSRQ